MYGPFLGTLNIRCRILIDHNFDNHPHTKSKNVIFESSAGKKPEALDEEL